MKWLDIISFEHSFDGLMRLLFVAVIGGLIVMYSTVFEAEYGDKLIDLYMKPWWRILVVLLVVASAIWCPRVGVIVAVAAFFYLNDMETLVSPLGITEK